MKAAFSDHRHPDTRLVPKEASMKQSGEHRAGPRISRALATGAVALLCVVALSQPVPAYADGGGGGSHGGGGGGGGVHSGGGGFHGQAFGGGGVHGGGGGFHGQAFGGGGVQDRKSGV